jgi:hypothetical protein
VRNLKMFSASIINFCVSNQPLSKLSALREDEEADRLDTIGDVKCRTENTPERLFCRSCAGSRLFNFAKMATAQPRKRGRLRF